MQNAVGRNDTDSTGRSIQWRADLLTIQMVYCNHLIGDGGGHQVKCRFFEEIYSSLSNAS